jgi:hypothetical protein
LTDENATREKILDALRGLQREVEGRPDDTVVLFLAGRAGGVSNRDAILPRTWHFQAVDHAAGREKATSLASEELHRLLASMPCRKLVVLDTDHSEASADAIRDLTPDGIGPSILTSGRTRQKAAQNLPINRGLFAHVLLEALGNDFARADVNKDGLLSPRELALYVQRRMAALNPQAGDAKQAPQFQAASEREALQPLFAQTKER